MTTDKIELIPYDDQLRDQILYVWEASVLASHHFLSQADFESIKKIVQTIDFNAFEVFCLLKDAEVLGFIGVADRKVEMLFLSPDYFRSGYGKRLMHFAMNELSADKVDVNEQNIHAVQFYRSLGFETYERSELDDQGYHYPILRMALNQSI
ncbi:MAG: GNAT family N-acetyltransferase [Saprospiraceae bacterium]|nr:GNAT family N-acetyltransferase [Saprospiraceae bacterium]